MRLFYTMLTEWIYEAYLCEYDDVDEVKSFEIFGNRVSAQVRGIDIATVQ
jgi:hypothetical protein